MNSNENTNLSANSGDVEISLKDARDSIHLFNELILSPDCFPSDEVSKTKACHISFQDLERLRNETGAHGIRCYLGLRFRDELGKKAICLVTVATQLVDGVYVDIIHPDPNTGIYDLTMPCPNTCDPKGLLTSTPH